MSTLGFVPEIAALSDQEGPVQTLRTAGVGALLSGAAGRLRRSDGLSHARSLAFVTTLLSLQGMIALVATFAAFGNGGFGRAVEVVAVSAAPGPVGHALEQAVNQAERTAGLGRVAPLLLGVAGALFLGTTGMGQLQRAVNRLYGIERDRPAYGNTCGRSSWRSPRAPPWPSHSSPWRSAGHSATTSSHRCGGPPGAPSSWDCWPAPSPCSSAGVPIGVSRHGPGLLPAPWWPWRSGWR